METANFPYDPVNRIQKLYYEYDFDDIPTIYNKNKLIKTKTKFIKYFKYCMKHVKTVLTPQIEEWDKQFADLTKELDELESKEKQLQKQRLVDEERALHNITLNVIKRRNDVRRHNQSVSLERELVQTMCVTLGLKLDYIIAQIRRIRKNYKKCNRCKKTAMITICDCKSKHRLCSECIDDKTECPVCKDDFGLQNCAICMENKNKKEFVNTGCKNEHKTCKECLDKIKNNNNRCPFCRDYLGHRHTTNNENISPRILDYVVRNSNTFRDISEENPFIRYRSGINVERSYDRGRGRINIRNMYSREQSAESGDWTHYNEYNNWLESLGIIERIELLNNGETRERAITEVSSSHIADAPPNELLEIPIRDIELVMDQAGCTRDDAINAINATNDMDIVAAIMHLAR